MSRAEESLALLVALVPYLLDRGRATVQETAAHFGVGDDEIRESVMLLAMSGIPDHDGNVFPNDMFDLAWDSLEDDDVIELTQLVGLEQSPRLGAREAAALIAGLELIRAMPGNDREAMRTLQQKLRRAATGEQSGLAIESRQDSALAETLRAGIERRTVVVIDYRKPDAPAASRRVVPIRLEFINETAFLRAWDLERRAGRSFRLDRIEDARPTSEPAPAEAVIEPEDPVFQLTEGALELELIASDAGAALLADYVHEEPQRRGDGRLDVRIRVTQLQAVVRAIAALGGEAVIVGPPLARRAMLDLATRARAAYAGQDSAAG